MSFEKLLKGFRAFHAAYFEGSNHYAELVRKGQSPDTLVIACSDSRNDPALLTQSRPGDIFVVRNVAAIVPPYQPDNHYHGTSAAIEFAVRGLQVKNIIVLGHALCGGVAALRDGAATQAKNFEFLTPWIAIGEPARELVEKHLAVAPAPARQQALEQAMIVTSLNNLMSFPWIKGAVAGGALTLHGWYFDMTQGQLLGYDFANGQFRDIGMPSASIAPSGLGSAPCCDGWSVENLVRKHAAQLTRKEAS